MYQAAVTTNSYEETMEHVLEGVPKFGVGRTCQSSNDASTPCFHRKWLWNAYVLFCEHLGTACLLVL